MPKLSEFPSFSGAVDDAADQMIIWDSSENTSGVSKDKRILLQHVVRQIARCAYVDESSDPGASDDETLGYRVGNFGVNLATGEAFVCKDATEDNAVWDSLGNTAAGDMLKATYDSDDDGKVDVAERLEETVATDSDSGSTHTLDLATGTVHQLTLTDDCTLSFSNVPSGGFAITLELAQDGTGDHTVTWPAAVTWAEGTAPTLSTAANAVDVITLYTPDGGTTWRGALVGLAFA